MNLKKLLPLLMCLIFVMAVLTGCGSDGEEFDDSYGTEYETEDESYGTGDETEDESYDADDETEDLSAELDFKVFSDGSLKAAFLDGDCFIDLMDGEELLQAVDNGPYTWDGTSGTIDGEVNDLTFTIEDGVLILIDENGEVYALPSL